VLYPRLIYPAITIVHENDEIYYTNIVAYVSIHIKYVKNKASKNMLLPLYGHSSRFYKF